MAVLVKHSTCAKLLLTAKKLAPFPVQPKGFKMPILPVIIDDMLISAFERINGRRNITGINHPELNILRREMAARQGRYFVLMRQAVNEIAHEIGKEHKIELRFHIRKYQWGELASAMETLKRLAPGNDTVPDGCSRAISRMQQLAYGR